MPHALWKGAISFGLVHIPVGLYSAEKRNSFDLTMVDRRTMKPVGFKRYNKETGEEVSQDQIVKGYEYEKNRYVILTDEDFRRANIEATQTINILRFVDQNLITPLFFETPYYLTPEARGEKGYVLLRDILKQVRRVGIATVVIHTRQYVAALLPVGEMIVMNTLRYTADIKDAHDLELLSKRKAEQYSPKEKEMAIKLVKEMTGPWNPEDYHDTYHEDLLALIDKRIKAGQIESIGEEEIRAADKQPKRGKVIDLMAMLKHSLRDNSKKGLQSHRRAGISHRPRRRTG